MNRYTYVLNNPLSLIDPLGLEDPDCGADDTVCVNGGGGGDPGDPTDPDPSDPGNPSLCVRRDWDFGGAPFYGSKVSWRCL
jgi:hypothetical protein